ncbi:MAG: chromosome partitioning protein ParA, partial [Chloroflexi bacterium]|nr:chromosome partitioning protein ParA [Chloroflexota bacterium]
MPVVRPFRALRYSPEAVTDLASVVAPPYDVIGPDEHLRLLARDPRNAVRLDLPTAEPGDADPDERYRRAARLLAAWRGDGTLRRDSRPAVYVVADSYRLPGG